MRLFSWLRDRVGADGQAQSARPQRSKSRPAPRFRPRLEAKAAGEVKPPSMSLTGPASPRRLVCAPGTMAFSFYRRPILNEENLP